LIGQVEQAMTSAQEPFPTENEPYPAMHTAIDSDHRWRNSNEQENHYKYQPFIWRIRSQKI